MLPRVPAQGSARRNASQRAAMIDESNFYGIAFNLLRELKLWFNSAKNGPDRILNFPADNDARRRRNRLSTGDVFCTVADQKGGDLRFSDGAAATIPSFRRPSSRHRQPEHGR